MKTSKVTKKEVQKLMNEIIASALRDIKVNINYTASAFDIRIPSKVLRVTDWANKYDINFIRQVIAFMQRNVNDEILKLTEEIDKTQEKIDNGNK